MLVLFGSELVEGWWQVHAEARNKAERWGEGMGEGMGGGGGLVSESVSACAGPGPATPSDIIVATPLGTSRYCAPEVRRPSPIPRHRCASFGAFFTAHHRIVRSGVTQDGGGVRHGSGWSADGARAYCASFWVVGSWVVGGELC